MTWFAFQGLNSGKAVDLAGTQEKQAVVEGFHGYATETQAEANPNSVNAVTRYFADLWISDYKAAKAEKAQPGGKNASNPLAAGAQGVKQAAQDAANDIPGVQAIGDFFSRLTEANTWIRIGEGLLGVILLAVGAAKMTNAIPAATKIARMVA